jgi:RNA polymerase sigma-70 factor (ECF subfamily)
MRHMLVDAARTSKASKRGGDCTKISFEERYFAVPGRDRQIVALDDALEDLSRKDPRKAQTLELRFFGGLNMEEIAAVMGISVQRCSGTGISHRPGWQGP